MMDKRIKAKGTEHPGRVKLPAMGAELIERVAYNTSQGREFHVRRDCPNMWAALELEHQGRVTLSRVGQSVFIRLELVG